MTEPVVVFEGVSKWYRREIEHHNLRSAMPGRLGNQVAREALVALDDVSFELTEGEALGVIGPNGAGKSTLLKLLARVTGPSKGRVATRGRIASLLELGIGFHPDLSGEENVRFSAAVLGMTPKEIERKYATIVEFSGIGDFMKMPVKRYSTGMKARLGFAVATHVDADILLVDEVMAVGDAEFQRQGFERIRELRNAGVSSVFVAHNVWMVGQLCNWVLRLDHGKVIDQGPASGVIDRYGGVGASTGQVWVKSGAQVLAFSVDPPEIDPGDGFTLRAQLQVERPLTDCKVVWGLAVEAGRPAEWLVEIPEATAVLSEPDTHDIVGHIESLPITPNEYHLVLYILDNENEGQSDEPSRPFRPISAAGAPLVVRGERSGQLHPAIHATWGVQKGVAAPTTAARRGVTMAPIDLPRDSRGLLKVSQRPEHPRAQRRREREESEGSGAEARARGADPAAGTDDADAGQHPTEGAP